MDAVQRLVRDHQILRAKLTVLESVLHMRPEAWGVVREMCVTLSRQLRDHIKREEDLVAACREAKVLAQIVVEHRDEPDHLRAISRMFVSQQRHSFEESASALRAVISALRRHMAQEEAELFPILERALRAEERRAPDTPARSRRLDEAMTVNRVVQGCPATRGVFERFFINVPVEGCACLDEVAWRHGLDTRELLQNLEDAISSCECAKNRLRALFEPIPEELDAVR